MADKRIDELVAVASVGDADLFVTEQTSVAKKATGANLASYVNSKFGLSTLNSKVSTLETAVAGKQDALTFPLPISQGGTGQSDSSRIRTNLSYNDGAYNSPFGSSQQIHVTGTLPVASGGTGATTAAGALSALGAAEYESVIRYIHGNNSENNFQVYLPCVNGVYDSVYEIKRFENVVYVNGNVGNTSLRTAQTGTSLTVSDSQPTPTRVPDWYVDSIPGFVIGHDYQLEAILLSGTYTPATTGAWPRITIRNNIDGLNDSKDTVPPDNIWTCHANPQMISFNLLKGNFDHCVFFIKITDLTLQQEAFGIDALPYYWKSYMETKASEINMASTPPIGNGSRFIFITDTHLREADMQWRNACQSPKLMKYLHDNCNIGLAFFGGDAIVGSYSSQEVAMADLQLMRDVFSPVWDWMYCIVGNHDYGNNSVQGRAPFPIETVYNILQRDKEHDYERVAPTGSYVLDDKAGKIRFICLDQKSDNTFTDDSVFFCNAMNETPAGWTIVFFTHWTANDTKTDISARLTETYSVIPAIHAYNSRVASYTMDAQGHTIDFQAAGAEVACIIGGHSHEDLSYTTSGGIPVICTTTDQYAKNDVALTGRARYTTTEQAFDVFTIDTVNKTITTKRIGYGVDRSFTYGTTP